MPLRKIYLSGKGIDKQNELPTAEVDETIRANRGYDYGLGNYQYEHKTEKELLSALHSWSPVVRSRAGFALGEKECDVMDDLVVLLEVDDHNARLGACQAIEHIGESAASAVPELTKLLDHRDLWTRIMAARALAGIGEPAKSTAPKMLRLAIQKDPDDPRAHLQRFMSFCLFNKRTGLLSSDSLEGIDKVLLRQAVEEILHNDDALARTSLANSAVFKQWTYEDVKPLLPVIYDAIIQPAPSDVMHQAGIRMAGLKLLARHCIVEGLDAALYIIVTDTPLNYHLAMNRIDMIENVIKQYGSAAKRILPQLEAYMPVLEAKVATRKKLRPGKGARWETMELIPMRQAIKDIKALKGPPPELRSLGLKER